MPTFDIVSRTNIAEVDNAVQSATREIGTRYDFKGGACAVERVDETLVIHADDDFKLKQVHDLLLGHMAKRKVNPAAFEFGDPQQASGGTVRQTVLIKQGIDRELAQKIVKAVKGEKMKVQVAIQGDELRATAKKRDDLQAVIALVKGLKIEHPLQFVNMRD